MAVHPRESVTVKTYVSGHNESKSSVLAEFDHEYEYGKVPPVTVISIVPSQTPLQLTSVVIPLTSNRPVL